MSHLVDTVNAKGISSIQLDDFSDVNLSNVNGSDVLSFQTNSNKFENTSASGGELRGASFGWANTSPGVGGAQNLYHPTSRAFFINYYYGGATTVHRYLDQTSGDYRIYPQRLSWYGSFSWFQGFFVPAGTHLIKMSTHVYAFTSTSEITVRFCIGGFSWGTAPTTSNTTFVGPHFYHSPRQGRFNSIPMAVIETTAASSFIGLRIVSSTSCALSATPLGIASHVSTL